MKALSIHQPWASLVMLNAKHFETRSWRTHYRGPLLIHACKYIPLAAQGLAYLEPFKAALAPLLLPYHPPTAPDGNVWDLPRGCLLGVVNMVNCLQTATVASCLFPYENKEAVETEKAFGDYSPGRWAWQFRVLQRFEQPIPMPGHMKLWDVPDNLLVTLLDSEVERLRERNRQKGDHAQSPS